MNNSSLLFEWCAGVLVTRCLCNNMYAVLAAVLVVGFHRNFNRNWRYVLVTCYPVCMYVYTFCSMNFCNSWKFNCVS